MLTVYKIFTKEHDVADNSTTDKISVLEFLLWKYLEYVSLILHNYKKRKRIKIL